MYCSSRRYTSPYILLVSCLASPKIGVIINSIARKIIYSVPKALSSFVSTIGTTWKTQPSKRGGGVTLSMVE